MKNSQKFINFISMILILFVFVPKTVEGSYLKVAFEDPIVDKCKLDFFRNHNYDQFYNTIPGFQKEVGISRNGTGFGMGMASNYSS